MLGTAVFGFALGPSPLVYRVLIKRAACGHPLPLYIYKEAHRFPLVYLHKQAHPVIIVK